ncbi:hypothetical protein BFJ71_g16855 [Fusarium oxysporum]|nr:hypothetical protein BFJ71_g16855 [Fusarium oxysporum]
MGRRALSAQERADKAARERDRSRRYRLAAHQKDSIHPDNSHPHAKSSDLSNLPGNPLTEIAREESSILPHNNEQRDGITLNHHVDDQPVSGILRRSRTPPLIQSITTTHDPIIQVDETTLQPDVSTQSIDQHAYPNAIYITAKCPRTANYQNAATVEDEAESISAAEASSLNFPIQAEQQAICRPGRRQKDPALSPRARTRLRVQRHRGQQHLTKAQQIVEQFDITQELPPTAEFSSLALHDDPDSPLSANEAQPGPGCRPDGGPDPESGAEPILFSSSPRDLTAYVEDGDDSDVSENFRPANDAVSDLSIIARPSSTGSTQHNSQSPQHRNSASSSTPSPPALLPSPLSSPSSIPSVGRDESILSGYLQAINEQDTAGGPDFLRQQGEVYDRVLRAFFSHQCNYAVTITRQWDVDSIWLGAKNLSAIRAPNQFRLSFFSPHKSNLSTDQVIQPHGLDLAHTRHTSIGTFITAGIRFSVLVFFPDGARSKTPASSNSLSLARFRDLYDDIILPAIYETVPDHVKQEIPGSYDLIYAKSRAYQEKPGMGRWSAEDESRSYRLAYAIPASVLSHFWAAVVRNANRHRVQNKKGDAIPYFKNPRLLFQAHDLKNTFATDNLQESLALFRDTVLAGLDPTQIDIHSCWLDIGMRDHVRTSTTPPGNESQHHHEPWTLLWKSDCCRYLHDQMGDIAPETPIEATYYRPYLLRDAGGYYAKAKSTRKSNPGSPEARSSGLIRAKAYNCSKELFGVMFSDYQLFSSGFLPLLAFDEGMLKDLAVTDQSRQRAFVSQLNRSRLLDAWDANKRHMRAVSSLKRHPNFGARKEVTLRLDVILAMWASGRLEPDQSHHTGPMCWEVPLSRTPSFPHSDDLIIGEQQHCPFWVIPTRILTSFVSTQAARFILPLNYIFSAVTTAQSSDPASQILAFYTAQLFCRLLIHAVSSEREYRFDNWIWKATWQVRCRSPKSCRRKERRGLGLGDSIRTSGTLWIPDSHINWQTGHISLELLLEIYMSRSPLQAKLAHQTNIQALATSQVTVELLFQRLLQNAGAEYSRGHNEDAEILADRAIALAAEEIARAYHQHFLAKLHSYWDRLRGKIGRQKLPVLDLLQQAQEESAAETGRIPTAQTIHGIYAEAWAKYYQVTADSDGHNGNTDESPFSLGSTLPKELPY